MMMWRQISSTLLLLLSSVSVVGAFTTQSQRAINSRLFQSAASIAPPSRKSPKKKASNSALANSATQSFGPVSNFLSNFPWVAKRQLEREERALRLESAKLHRQLGVAEDASYEDITAICDTLIAQTNGNIKQKVKIEMAKDRILQLKLNARIKGLTRMDSSASEGERMAQEERDGVADDGETLSKKDQEDLDKYPFPEWTRGIIVPPDAAWRNRQLTVWGSMYVFSSLSPACTVMASYGSFFALTVNFLNRGYVRDAAKAQAKLDAVGANPWSRRYFTGDHGKLAWGLGLLLTPVIKLLSVVTTPPFIRDGPSGGQIIRVVEFSMLCFISMYVQLAKDEKKQPRPRRKGGGKKKRPKRGGDEDDD